MIIYYFITGVFVGVVFLWSLWDVSRKDQLIWDGGWKDWGLVSAGFFLSVFLWPLVVIGCMKTTMKAAGGE